MNTGKMVSIVVVASLFILTLTSTSLARMVRLDFEQDIKDRSSYLLSTQSVGSTDYVYRFDKSEYALDLTRGGYVVVRNSDALGGVEGLTVSAWAKKGYDGMGGYLVHKHAQYALRISQEAVHCYVISENGDSAYITNSSVPDINDDEWHHYKVEYDGAEVTLFVDDIVIGRQPLTGPVRENSGHNLLIGKYPWEETTFNGYIDNVLILPYALKKAPEIPSDFQAHVLPGGVKLTWVDQSNNECGFNIRRYDMSDPFIQEETMTTLPDVTSFNDTTVEAGKIYTYYLEAYNKKGIQHNAAPCFAEVTTGQITPSDSVLLMQFDSNLNDDSKHMAEGIMIGEGGILYESGHDGTGSALQLAGTRYVDVENSDVFGGMDQLTVSVWAKKNTPASEGHLIHKHGQYELQIGQRSVRCYVGNENGELAYVVDYSVPEIENTDWHHYEIRYDGSVVRLIVDSQEVGSNILTGPVRKNSGHDLHIGKKTWNDTIFNGLIDDLELSGFNSNNTPETPGNLRAFTEFEGMIHLEWEDRSDTETGFIIERSMEGDFTDAVTRTINTPDTAYYCDDSGLVPGSVYFYRVRAVNDSGESAFSNTSFDYNWTLIENTIADHTVAKESVLKRIPESAIKAARKKLHVMYCGQGVSTQMVSGMSYLPRYKQEYETRFAVTFDGRATAGGLDIHYKPGPPKNPVDVNSAGSLSDDTPVDEFGHTNYFRKTVEYLDHPYYSDINVVIWSWDEIDGENADIYFRNFIELIDMYSPGGSKGRWYGNDVTFVWMTGSAGGPSGIDETDQTSPYMNHKKIVEFCQQNGFFCIDFWSQDTHDYQTDVLYPDTQGYSPEHLMNWMTANPDDWYYCYPTNAAQYHLLGNRRAYAAWWVFARIAGWDGTLQ